MPFELPNVGTRSSSGSSDVIAPFKYQTPKPKKKKKDDLTARQILAVLQAKEHKPSRSFGSTLKGVGKGALGGATWTLTQLMRPSWAVVSGSSEGLSRLTGRGGTPSKSIAGAALRGFAAQKDYRKGFGEVLGEQGVLEGHRGWRGGIGFGLDVATDPILAMSIAADVATGGAAAPMTAAYLAAKTGGGAASKTLLRKAAVEQGAAVVERNATNKVAREILEEAGPDFQAQKALAEFNYKAGAGMLDDAMTPEVQQTYRHMYEAMAEAEMRKNHPAKIAFKFGYGKRRIKVRTPIPAISRPGTKLANADIPIISQLSNKLGQAFVPDFKKEITHAATMQRKHIANQNALIVRNMLREHFTATPMKRGLLGQVPDNRKILEILDLFEKPIKTTRGGYWKAVVPMSKAELKEAKLLAGQEGYKLNEQYIKFLKSKGYIDDQGEQFVREWFDATKMMDTADVAAGVARDNWHKSTMLYVPHVFDRKTGEVPSIIQKTIMSKAGFQKSRSGKKSLLDIENMKAAGQLPNHIVTDPFALLWRRARAGGERQADMALVNTLGAAAGIPSRLVNAKRVGALQARLEVLAAEKAGAYRAAAAAEKDFNQAYDDGLHELGNLGWYYLTKAKAQRRAKVHAARADKKIELESRLNSIQMGLLAAKKPETIARLTKELDKVEQDLLKVARSRPQTPEIIRRTEHIKMLERRQEIAIAEFQTRRGADWERIMGDFEKPLNVANKAKQRINRKYYRTQKQLEKAMRGRPNPAVRNRDLIDAKLADEMGNTLLFEKEAGETLGRLQRIIAGEDQAIEEFTKGFHAWMGAWKIMVTTVNPGYRIRNTMTDFWNMWLAGVPPHAMAKYGAQAARIQYRSHKFFKNPTAENRKALEMVTEAADHGILAGLFGGDVQNITRYILKAGSTKELAARGKVVSSATHAVQEMNKNAENWGRLTHYLYRRMALKESSATAARKVKLAHFDYEDLTPFEQKYMKNFFPFYTWSRKNIPYQVKKIFTEPGRYSVFPKMAQEATYVANEPEGNIVPDYVSEGFGFANPLVQNNYLMPQLGVSDLEVFQSPQNALERPASLLGPHIKMPIEMWMNKSFFTKQPIKQEGHPYNPISNFGGSVLGGLGVPIHKTRRVGSGQGQYIESKGINPWLGYAIGNVPMARAVFGLGANTPGKRGSQLASYLGGMNNQMVDQEQQVYFQSREIMQSVDEFLASLRDAGEYPTKKRKMTEFDKMLLRLLKGYNG